MNRFVLALILGVAATATVRSQTYYVASSTVTYSGGWPGVNYDTRTGSPPFLGNGFVWQASSGGGQLNPGGLQADGSHNKVDAYYQATSDATYYGNGILQTSAAPFGIFNLDRYAIAVKFKIRCSYASTPPTAGQPVFSMRCRSNGDVNPVSSPAWNRAWANATYIAPGGTAVSDNDIEAYQPGGLEGDDGVYRIHRNETGDAPGAWTSLGGNLWEVEVTVPVPDLSVSTDQQIDTIVEGTSASFGSFATARSHAHGIYEMRVISLGGVTLQSGY